MHTASSLIHEALNHEMERLPRSEAITLEERVLIGLAWWEKHGDAKPLRFAATGFALLTAAIVAMGTPQVMSA